MYHPDNINGTVDKEEYIKLSLSLCRGVAPFDLEPTVYYNVFNPADVNSKFHSISK